MSDSTEALESLLEQVNQSFTDAWSELNELDDNKAMVFALQGVAQAILAGAAIVAGSHDA